MQYARRALVALVLVLAAFAPSLYASGFEVTAAASPVNVADADTGLKPGNALPWVHPVPDGVLSSGYGMRWGKMHKGIDLAGPLGTPIYAPMDSTMTKNGPEDGFGWVVVITNGTYTIKIGHVPSASAAHMPEGTTISRGDQIAAIGNEGVSTGSHAHVELIHNGQHVDPIILIQGAPGPDRVPFPPTPPTPPAPPTIEEQFRALLEQHGIQVPGLVGVR